MTADRRQMQRMHALFSKKGVTQRDARLAYAGAVACRPVDSTADLSGGELAVVIAALEGGFQPPTQPEGATS